MHPTNRLQYSPGLRDDRNQPGDPHQSRRDDEAGEVPKAFVVLKGEASAAAIMDFIAARVAPHKKIREVEFIAQIPKSLSGKILRRVLIEEERAQAASDKL